MSKAIRYFGADVAFGEDCQPLSRDQAVALRDHCGNQGEMTVAKMTNYEDTWRPQVSYVVLPS